MGLISYTNIEDNTPASANVLNQRFGDIIDEVNGNLDSANLKDQAVTRAKIATGAVNNDKLDLSSQNIGGSNYMRFGNFMIQWGVSQIASTGTTVNFAVPFAATPGVVLTTEDPNSQQSWTTGRSPIDFSAKQPYATNPLSVSWIALGPVA